MKNFEEYLIRVLLEGKASGGDPSLTGHRVGHFLGRVERGEVKARGSSKDTTNKVKSIINKVAARKRAKTKLSALGKRDPEWGNYEKEDAEQEGKTEFARGVKYSRNIKLSGGQFHGPDWPGERDPGPRPRMRPAEDHAINIDRIDRDKRIRAAWESYRDTRET